MSTLKGGRIVATTNKCDCRSSDCVSRSVDMAAQITGFGHPSFYDWMMQHKSALVLSLYTLFIIGYLWLKTNVMHTQWDALLEAVWVSVFGLVVFLSIGIHSWISLWSISIDCIKLTGSRFFFQSLCCFTMFIYIVWRVQVIWGL